MLEKIVLPETVHEEATYLVWQRRFYDFNVWNESKRLEKLHYMHGNPLREDSWRIQQIGLGGVGVSTIWVIPVFRAMQPIHVNRPTEWRSLLQITILLGAAFSLGRQCRLRSTELGAAGDSSLFSDKLNSSLW